MQRLRLFLQRTPLWHQPSLTKTSSAEIWKIPAVEWHRQKSPAEVCFQPPDRRECFDMKRISVERGGTCHAKQVRSFLYTHHWPREPCTSSLYMPLDSEFLRALTERYAYSSDDRFLAYEREPRTGERRLVGVCAASKVLPWAPDELEEWAHHMYSRPDRTRCYFMAHCLREPDLFVAHHVPYIYDIEVLTTSADVTGQGIATLLLRHALHHAKDLRHPLVQIVATSSYVSKICERVGLQRAWSMKYKDYVDDGGQSVFFPRRPHTEAAVYFRPFSCALGAETPCQPPW